MAAVDGSPYAGAVAEHAAELAALAGASVLAVYVVDSRLVEGALARLLAQEFTDSPWGDAGDTIGRLLESEGRRVLDMAQAVCERRGVKCELRIDRGRPAAVLASLAPLYDLAVIGSYGSEMPLRSSLLGSTAWELIRLSTRPIMVAREEYKRIGHAVVGYDGSPEATRALDTVIDLAAAGNWKLTIAVIGETSAAHELAARAKQFRGLDKVAHETVVRGGDPAYGLLKILDETGADLAAVGSRGRQKLARLLLGSTSETLLREAAVPVIVFK